MRRIGAGLVVMIGLGIGLAFWAGAPAPAQDTQEQRIAGLESRVAELETVTSATDVAEVTPTPTPDMVWQEGETFDIAGDGPATVNLWAKQGTYDVTFICDAAGGFVRIWFPLMPNGGIELASGTTNHMEFPEVVSEDVTSVMLDVSCAGAWRITGTP